MNQKSATPNPPLSLDPNRQYVIGTAGHIDHGKTALVKALTGVDTDRLPEEKARGITIDIGFAHLGENVTIIDVPGHERLIKNMVAGVSTIDLVLFVIAADDGVMPQSREHLDIIQLLQIPQGIFVISKTDLVNEEWLALAEEDIRAFLRDTPFQNAPLVKTSVASGQGIAELKNLLLTTLTQLPARQDVEIYRQPVDRVFTVKGFGTVITGTVLSGKLSAGEEIEIQPGGHQARVRGLQSHGREVTEVHAGFRAAVNLAGIEVDALQRGMALAQPGLYHPAEVINARISVLKSSPIALKNNQRLRLHIHTAETFARVIFPQTPQIRPGESAFAQLRLEQPVHAAYRDRFIIRQFSPQRTIGGGTALQINPFRFRKKYEPLFRETLQRLESGDPQEQILAAFDRLKAQPLKLWEIKIATNQPQHDLQKQLKEMHSAGLLFSDTIGGKTVYFSREQLEEVCGRIETMLAHYHQQYPGRAGISDAEITSRLEKFFTPEAIRKALNYGLQHQRFAGEGKSFRLLSFAPQLSAKDNEIYAILENCYREALYIPPTVKEAMEKFKLSPKEFKELSKMLREDGKLVYVDETLFFHHSVLEKLENELQNFFRRKPEMTVTEFKEITGATRKHAIPLLVYLDARGVTEREGDVRRPGPKLGGG